MEPRQCWWSRLNSLVFNMDIDKFVVFFKAVGFPAAVAVWFLWKIQGFMDALTVSQTSMVELLRQLVELHK